MRIITGRLGGRQFDSPKSDKTHPMSDKARGALFNMLGDIEGLTVLDPFAGSGALSFEAVSRGAMSAVAIDNERAAQDVIEASMKTLGLEGDVKLIRATATTWIQTNSDQTFDLVLCDPPYDDLQEALLQRLALCVNEGGLMVLSWPDGTEPPAFDGLKQIERRSYAGAQIIFYRKG